MFFVKVSTLNRLISIVVPAFNEQRELPALLGSLRSITDNPAVEILVVDNGSLDDTARVAAELGARVLRITRASVGAARNTGARTAEGRVLAFVDADIVVSSSWKIELLGLANSTWAGEITGDVCDVSPAPSWLERYWFGAIYARGAVNYVNSGNLIICRGDFFRVGGFNESLMSGEDVDLCSRAQAIGIRLAARRTLHVRHLGFPRTIIDFVRREAWHGRGDFVNMPAVCASPVARATLGFVGLHLLVLYGLVAGNAMLAVCSIAALGGLCMACSLWKFRAAPLRMRIANVPIFYCYFLGRARSVWDLFARSR